MLDDDPARAARKIMSATTDSVGRIRYDMFTQPGISNLLQIEALVTDTPLETVVNKWAGQTSYGDLKRAVGESVSAMLSDFQSKLTQISDDEVLEALHAGEIYANEIANAKLLEAQKAFGLR